MPRRWIVVVGNLTKMADRESDTMRDLAASSLPAGGFQDRVLCNCILLFVLTCAIVGNRLHFPENTIECIKST